MSNVVYLAAGRDQPAGILLIESDPLARIAAAGHLRKAGLTVLEAVDGAEALTLLRAGRTPSLVFGELADVIGTLQHEFPEVKLLLGCARDTIPVARNRVGTVRRPYDLREVERMVKALLVGACRPN